MFVLFSTVVLSPWMIPESSRLLLPGLDFFLLSSSCSLQKVLSSATVNQELSSSIWIPFEMCSVLKWIFHFFDSYFSASRYELSSAVLSFLSRSSMSCSLLSQDIHL